ASSKTKAVAVPATESRSLVIPTLVALGATATLLLLLTPSVVRAQAKPAPAHPAPAHPAAPAAHSRAAKPETIQGEAHGALAAQTAGKADAPAREAPKALPKGARAAAAKVAKAAPAPEKAEPTIVVTHAAVPAESGANADADEEMAFDETSINSSTKIWGADVSTQRGARGDDQVTIFLGRSVDVKEVDLEVQAMLPSRKPAPRRSEYVGAPFAVTASGLLRAGVVGHRSGSANSSFKATERLVLFDESEITLPAGVAAKVGERFVSVDATSLLKPGVQMVLPAGVLEVVRADEGRPVIARVVSQTGRVEEGQKLLPLEGEAVASDVPVAVVPRSANAPETQVVWVSGDALLPSVQSYLMLGAAEREGVVAGDQFAIVKRLGLGPDAQEQRIALVRVVRVNEHGSTAIVIRQDQPGIAVGGAARLVGHAVAASVVSSGDAHR
ncbi:MAG: hypothetical protein ACO1Q7_01655, partial [Gemmatimonas sp.]